MRRRSRWAAAVTAALSGLLALSGTALASADWAPAAPYVSPLEPMRAVELARIPPEPWLAGHRGIDLATEIGAPVSSPASGVVEFAGWVVDRGVVTVRHRDGAVTSLEPVDATASPGDRVERGDLLGTVSEEPGHCAPAVCVHWGVRVNGDYIDPLDVLDGYGPVRLLPRSAQSFGRRRALR